MGKVLEKAFGFVPGVHDIRSEVIGGITTFFTMAYILAVLPSIFAQVPGMPAEATFTATAAVTIIATLFCAFIAHRPISMAPDFGSNAFIVYTLCLGMGHSWQFAGTAVLITGLISFALAATKVRERILDAIPSCLKHSIAAGIGIFLAFVGLQNSGLIVDDGSTLVTLGDITSGKGLLAVLGIVISCTLVMLHVRGGILIGIIATFVLGLFIKDPATGSALTVFNGVAAAPPSVEPLLFKFTWGEVLSPDMFTAVVSLLFMNMFGNLGSDIALSTKAGYVDKDGNVEGINRLFLSDGLGTAISGCFSCTPVTSLAESSAGIGAGGRTGFTAFVTALCFALALLLAPLFLAIPGSATAPALIIVGMMMMEPIVNVDWLNYRESIPSFLTVILMPMSYSIADGILIGVIAFVVLNALTMRWKKISATMWVLAAVFILKYIFF